MHFANAPALLGTVELVEGENRSALAVVHAFIDNQGDAWTITGASLDRLIDEQRLLPNEAVAEATEIGTLQQRMRQIGRVPPNCIWPCQPQRYRRLRAGADSAADTARWTEYAVSRAHAVFRLIEHNLKTFDEAVAPLARRLLDHRTAIGAHLESGWERDL
ncbi:MAG: hypothetical protein WDN48_17125 [Pseudolabrys sp.]